MAFLAPWRFLLATIFALALSVPLPARAQTQGVNGGTPPLPRSTFASLPSCVAGLEGLQYAVTDSNSAVFNAAVGGSGANHIIGYCNGTAWVVH